MMNPAVWARVLPAVLMLPLGGLAPRLALGVGAAALLSSSLPAMSAAPFDLAMEIGIGACLGLLAGLPAHAGAAFRGDGPQVLGFAGRIWSWAVFFGLGGPGLLLLGLGGSFQALPVGAWIDVEVVIAGGGALFYAALVLGLPVWLTNLVVGPLGAWIDRLSDDTLGAEMGRGMRPLVGMATLAALLPALLDTLRGLWLAGLADTFGG